MDRFKFRAWLIDEKRYGENINLFNCCNDTIYDVEEYDNKGSHYTMYRADEVVLEQSTGIKDKNGKLIYENDIVDFDDSETYATIEWGEDDGCWRIITAEKTIYTFDNLYGYELTVVGNIHTENINDM